MRENNKFAYKLLADTYLEQSRYGEAAEMYKEVIQMLNDEEVSVSLSLSVAACYVHEMDDLILEDSEKNASQISELQQQINETYFEIFQKEDMDPNLYLDAAISYAYYLCFHCMYENCYSFLCAVEEEYFGKVDAAYKINLAFGHLHGFEADDNPHFNLDFAIKHYRVAFYLAEQILERI